MLKYSFKFSIKNNTEDKETPLRLRVSFRSQRVELYTRIKVKPSHWNANAQKVNGNAKMNREINTLSKHIDDVFLQYEATFDRLPDREEFIAAFNEKTGKIKPKENNPLVLDVFDEFIKHQSEVKQWTEGTRKSYISIKNHFSVFNKEIRINDLTERNVLDFIKYFQTAPVDFRTGRRIAPHRNTTIEKNISDFKGMLSWAHKQKIYAGDLHESFKQVFKGTNGDLKELVYLEWDELMTMYYHDFGNDRLNNVRDVFCFCCFTGLRFSDVKNLAHNNIKDDYIFIATEKTIDPLRIELNDFSQSILDRHKGNSKPLPIISHDKTNEYLKEIAEVLEFNTPINEIYYIGEKRYKTTYLKKDVISTHAGRRTFVVNALKMNIPSIVVRSWTGHKDERAMRPYTKIVDELKANEMKKFNQMSPKNIPKNIETE